MKSHEAAAVMAEHFRAHQCSQDNPGCAVANENYVHYLIALAEEKGIDPESFATVRIWMRVNARRKTTNEADRLAVGVKRVVHEIRRLATPNPPTEKLVRHRVPQWFAERGEKVETRVAASEDMLGLLRAKVVEEAEELCEAIGAGVPAQILEEAVDLWEVIDAIRERLGPTLFDAIKNTKARERGTFHQGIVLKLGVPIPMVLCCPKCGGQHIDRGVWSSTRIHRTHLCEHCGETWKPFAFATIGVERLAACPDCGGHGFTYPDGFVSKRCRCNPLVAP